MKMEFLTPDLILQCLEPFGPLIIPLLHTEELVQGSDTVFDNLIINIGIRKKQRFYEDDIVKIKSEYILLALSERCICPQVKEIFSLLNKKYGKHSNLLNFTDFLTN